MPKKSSRQIKKDQRIRHSVICIFLLLLIIFTAFRMGSLGTFLNNILTFLFGDLYILVISIFFINTVYLLFSQTGPNPRISAGIVMINLFIILAYAYFRDEIALKDYPQYFISALKNVFSFDPLDNTAGILGNAMYVILASLISKAGSLIVAFAFFLIAMILIIPGESAARFIDGQKERHVENMKVREERKAQEKIEREKKEEERRARLAEEMARKAEEDEKRKIEEERLARQREEEERLAAERAEKEKLIQQKKDERERILSKSPTFINLNEEDIYGSKKNNKEEIREDTPEEIPLVSEVKHDQDGTRILKPVKSSSKYKLPRRYEDFLDNYSSDSSSINRTSAAVKGEKVIEILANFGISATLENTYIGPSVTKFEIKPDSSVKVNKINNIADNIKMELAARDIRIESPIPGRSAVGIEIPNVEPIPVRMLELINKIPNEKKRSELLFVLGKDLMGKPVYCEINRMPHLLIAGATGSGKSVCINSIITSLLLRTRPDEVKLVLVDPKKVEFTPYADVPHLLWPIIDDAQMAANMLKKIVVIMEDRYELFAKAGVRNLEAYNKAVDENNSRKDREAMERLPLIVVIIDELADLMAIAKKDVELSIQRITQLARASGIHLIVATQRPSTDVVTGLIKSNIPSRISFAVASSIDSRTILDQTGAERLLGNGDMLYYPQGESAPIRLQGVYVHDDEIARITKYVKSQAKPEYDDTYYEFQNILSAQSNNGEPLNDADLKDSLYDEAVEFVRFKQAASTSMLQRRFGIGYNRSARLIDTMEEKGIIGPSNGSKPREVYLKPEEDEE